VHCQYVATSARTPCILKNFFDNAAIAPYDCAPMSAEPLPETLDVRKAAAREAVVSGRVPLSSLSRLADVLASAEGDATARCRFSRDEENRSIVDVDVEATVQVTCQRCLQTMPLQLDVHGKVAVVGDDDAAKQLPAALEPWVVATETASLWHLVEDELMLALPVVAYHDSEDCKRLLDAYRRPPESGKPSGDNPFKVLERLKSGRTEEK